MSSTKIRKIKSNPLPELMTGNPYIAYTYSYPHKSSYRIIKKPHRLRKVWKKENTNHLFLYINIPFCQNKCAYCNLFSKTGINKHIIDPYLTAVKKQAYTLKNEIQSIKSFQINRAAIGGGTPTLLTPEQMNFTLDIIEDTFCTNLKDINISIETHPNTTKKSIINILKERGINRISIGIQSFIQNELQIIKRFTPNEKIHLALELLLSLDFQILNVDLIYGLPNQTVSSFLTSIEKTLSYEPDELYLYPLYIRPKTTLSRNQFNYEDLRLKMYERARGRLIEAGYIQDSIRLFIKRKRQVNDNKFTNEDEYNCNIDGMIGLGCGSRSYTRNFHYSEPYAISQKAIAKIISTFNSKSEDSFKYANYGIELQEEDVRRRFVLKSILKVKGLDIFSYKKTFQNDPFDDFPELDQLVEYNLASKELNHLILTQEALAWSDSIGTWLYSNRILNLMEDFKIL